MRDTHGNQRYNDEHIVQVCYEYICFQCRTLNTNKQHTHGPARTNERVVFSMQADLNKNTTRTWAGSVETSGGRGDSDGINEVGLHFFSMDSLYTSM